MARNRSRGTLVDYLVAAIEPALIMTMVGSLMFFLLDMWYAGEFLERLRWILFWFVFGIVLITRVSMRIGSSLAKAYGVALGGAVALVASTLTGFQPVLLVILGIVWWVTHKLTFDCTLLDEDQDAGVGLLQESGLDPSALADQGPPPAIEDPAAMDASLLPENSGQEDREAGRRRRPPAQCAGGLADLFHARLASSFWPGTVVRAGRRGRTAQRVVRVLSCLYLQRNGLAAGDELPQSPTVSPSAQAQDARGDDGDLAVDGHHRHRRFDCSGGGVAVARHGLERRARVHFRVERPPRVASGGAQG